MRFAEVFLRLGCSLVAWMVLYAHVLWLGVLGQTGCGPGGDEFHRLLLGLAPLSAAAILALAATRPLGDVHRTLRWLALPLAILGLFALTTTWQAMQLTIIAGDGFCSGERAATWERLWPLVQTAVLAGLGIRVAQQWRRPERDQR